MVNIHPFSMSNEIQFSGSIFHLNPRVFLEFLSDTESIYHWSYLPTKCFKFTLGYGIMFWCIFSIVISTQLIPNLSQFHIFTGIFTPDYLDPNTHILIYFIQRDDRLLLNIQFIFQGGTFNHTRPLIINNVPASNHI